MAEFDVAQSAHDVSRFVLPRLHALNFVLDDVLDGGVNDSLNLDSHGKTLAFHLLAMNVTLPVALRPQLRGLADSQITKEARDMAVPGEAVALVPSWS